MWLDDLKAGQGWWGIWYGLGHCGACGALHREYPCPVCGDNPQVEWIKLRDETGKDFSVPPTRQGAIASSTHVILGMMQREWDRPVSSDHWLDKQQDAPAQRAALVLLFWVLFEGLLERFYDAALSVCPDGVRNDLLRRYGHVGTRMNQLHRVLFGVTFFTDLEQQGDGQLTAHLREVQERRNAFVHGDPHAISDDLVQRTTELLQDVQLSYVKIYNRRCTRLPRITPVWDERRRNR
jgi:hypothetical protein